ncbi:LysR family transcriptional regulator [Marichromatium bheemlicum]|uniref:LysR family transcriptional regulator n=1 Tax=Marichromatium bheemlicum TaxID=365339 RepID=A0ABX1I4B0_9GAMM|nr:LysR family transcriptional regulator [Marichromatium bheemlicum]NKN31699.1 LysR family transcriptional regulator [Marichromatium bheemlicum]
MDIALLKTFIEVARHRHFGRAAGALCVSQSAVSARVKLLESVLGVVLFERRRGDIRLTESGQRLLQHAERIVRTWARARAELVGEQRHTLALGCAPDLWSLGVRERVAALRQALPWVELRLELLPAASLLQRLADATLDLALLGEPVESRCCPSEPLARIELVLVSRESGLALEQALGEGYILVDWGTRFLTLHAERLAVDMASRMRVDQGRVALELLEVLGGAAYLPWPWVAQAVEEGRLAVVDGAPTFSLHPHLAVRDGAIDRDPVDTAVALLRETGDAASPRCPPGHTSPTRGAPSEPESVSPPGAPWT